MHFEEDREQCRSRSTVERGRVRVLNYVVADGETSEKKSDLSHEFREFSTLARARGLNPRPGSSGSRLWRSALYGIRLVRYSQQHVRNATETAGPGMKGGADEW